MGRSSIKRLLYTISYLRWEQIVYRLYYAVRNRLITKAKYMQLTVPVPQCHWNLIGIKHPNSYLKYDTFKFLNISHNFTNFIDWNHSEHGKLWTYNLNYFDFLNQDSILKEDGLRLIHDYIAKDKHLKDGKEPYPISLRGINWIKFLTTNQINDNRINSMLFNHYQILLRNLEYHLLGNHLLENGFSLIFGSYYFQNEYMYNKGKKVILLQLEEQILEDGGHFERSPMYHQIILHRLLDTINLVTINTWKEQELLPNLTEYANKMLNWLTSVTYSNGAIPMVNDSAYDIAPSSKELIEYAHRLGLKQIQKQALTDSGYRTIESSYYEMFLDVGIIGPDYQPGHAHADTFSFELVVNESAIIVDTGTSTYEKNNKRNKERSTTSHNTVQIGTNEQSEVWGGFRVGRRAKIVELIEADNKISSTHNGYKNIGILHQRIFEFTEQEISILDNLSKPSNNQAKAFFHFAPEVTDIQIHDNGLIINSKIKIDFNGHSSIELSNYQYAKGFNKTEIAKKIIVKFDQNLETQICL